jgi:hypothetical protein
MKTKMIVQICLASLLGILNTLTLTGQIISTKLDLLDLFENNKLETFNRQLSPLIEGDKRGIRFSRNANDGIAWIKGFEFSNGTIELDIRGKDVFQQSFVGIAFHGVDNVTLDAIYFRPFNFRSTDPVRKIHAVQYISNPDFPWPVLREKYNGMYEKDVIPAPDGNEWFHTMIVIQYPMVKVYVNGNSEPCISVDKLNDRKTGKIGLWVGNNSDGDFANLQISTDSR